MHESLKFFAIPIEHEGLRNNRINNTFVTIRFNFRLIFSN